MNTNARHSLSAAGLGLLSFTLTSSIVSGTSAMPTLVGVALLAVYGAIEIAVLSYATPRWYGRRTATSSSKSRTLDTTASVLLPFPVVSRRECLARAA